MNRREGTKSEREEVALEVFQNVGVEAECREFPLCPLAPEIISAWGERCLPQN